MIKTPIEMKEYQFQNSLVEYSINSHGCSFLKNESQIVCSSQKAKDATSSLRLSDYWVEFDQLLPTQGTQI